MVKIKRLFFDIETSPNIGMFWKSGYKQDIPYDNIIKERSVICICYKWANEKKVHSLTWDKNQNDKKMLSDFISILNEADEIIGHNSDKFDLPWVKTRCLYHNIPAFPSYVTIDTLKIAKNKFNFQSNTLNYISKFLGLGSKKPTSLDLWKKIVLEKCDKSLDYMVKYCQQDVILLEKVFNKLKNYTNAKTHVGVLNNKPKSSCPECGSINTNLSKTTISALGIKKYQLVCKNCGKYHTISETTYNKK